jgi:hypothetical protein
MPHHLPVTVRPPHGAEAAAAAINAVAIDKTAINFFIASSPVQMTFLTERSPPTPNHRTGNLFRHRPPGRFAHWSILNRVRTSIWRSTGRCTNAVGIE